MSWMNGETKHTQKKTTRTRATSDSPPETRHAFPLLVTKFFTLHARPDLVPRPRLLEAGAVARPNLPAPALKDWPVGQSKIGHLANQMEER